MHFISKAVYDKSRAFSAFFLGRPYGTWLGGLVQGDGRCAGARVRIDTPAWARGRALAGAGARRTIWTCPVLASTSRLRMTISKAEDMLVSFERRVLPSSAPLLEGPTGMSYYRPWPSLPKQSSLASRGPAASTQRRFRSTPRWAGPQPQHAQRHGKTGAQCSNAEATAAALSRSEAGVSVRRP